MDDDRQVQIGALTKALVKARMETTPVVSKDGQNSQLGYRYVGHEHVLSQGARDALLNNGLALEQIHTECVGEYVARTRQGERLVLRYRGVYRLAHIEGAERQYTWEATVEANDKAGFVASTALDRTAHMRVLQLAGATTEDPEYDHDTGEVRQPRASETRTARSSAQTTRRAPPAASAPRTERAPASAAPDLGSPDLGELEARLATVRSHAALVAAAREILAAHGKPRETRLWHAFAARCEAMGAPWREVVDEAYRRRAVPTTTTTTTRLNDMAPPGADVGSRID